MHHRKGTAAPHRVDMTGKRCGLLTVVSYRGPHINGGYAMWNCVCDCGKDVIAYGFALREGRKISCLNNACHQQAKAILEEEAKAREAAEASLQEAPRHA